MLNTILDRISEQPTFRLAAKQFHSGGRVALFDMVPTQRLAFAIALSRQKPVIYLLPNERAARQAYQDAGGLGAEAIFIPQPELRFIRAVVSRETDWQRLRALDQIVNGEVQLIICSVEALQLHLPRREWFEQATLTFLPGQSYETSTLTMELAQRGYERVDLVEGKGQFALRGDILDIFPPQIDLPARIEFFDVQIDSIRAFDPLTQRSAQTLPSLRVCPANEHLIPPDERGNAASRLEQALTQHPGETGMLPAWESQFVMPDLEQLTCDGTIDNAALWAHLLYGEDASLLSWLPCAGVVLDTPDRASQRLEDADKAHIEMFTAALEANQAHPAQSGLLRTHEAITSLLKKKPLMLLTELLHGMGGLAPEHSHPFPGLRVESYRGRLQTLSSDIAVWQEQGFAVALYTGGQSRSERLAAALAAQGISVAISETNATASNIMLLPGSFSEGFLDTGAKLAVVAPGELFGSSRAKSRKARTAGQRIEAFSDLSVGDYVVHDHHGIGIYQGTVRLQSEGIWRDYLFIQYRGSDKLYVPADQFDRVQKYIGSPDAAPPLNDLSSNTWIKQKSKVKAGLKQLAFDLVKLYAARQAIPGYAFEPFEPFEGQFADQFDYELTPDQEQAINEVLADMAQPRNMDRLLCGDVGYGKTEVAMRAAFRAVLNGKQVAFLAPTTILVQQHVRTMIKRFEGFPVNIQFVSRFRSPKENRKTLAQTREGKVDILVGTHRLLSRDVVFKNLGLLVIDEEQRFGVIHKEQIKNLKNMVDVLTLSATPIPRTLHMSMVGVRDMSLLETPPEDRFPVSTYVIDYSDSLIRDAILREIGREGQVYFLYNRVMDIERMASHLRQLIPEARIAVAHGQMPEQLLEDVMHEFYLAQHDVLLCSTIIENGLDIQNANTLIVYDADHFGLSQLYQLRGRVGRSTRAAYAFFTVRPDKSISETAQKRLTAIKEFTAFGAGFRIAMRDLEIRGAGNIFGPEQSGQVATVGYDMYVKMIEEAIREAQGDPAALRQSELETRVDLQVNAFLPEYYVRGEAQRIEIYKRISMIRSRDDESELIADLIDRFGEPEEPVMNLIAIARLRALANTLGADQVRYNRDALILRFDPQFAVDPVRLYLALSRIGKGMSLQAGKRTRLLIHLRGESQEEILRKGIPELENLLEIIEKVPQLET